MKGHKVIDSAPMIARKARVVANNHGDPCVLVYPTGRGVSSPTTYSLMQARQLAKDLNEALDALAGD